MSSGLGFTNGYNNMDDSIRRTVHNHTREVDVDDNHCDNAATLPRPPDASPLHTLVDGAVLPRSGWQRDDRAIKPGRSEAAPLAAGLNDIAASAIPNNLEMRKSSTPPPPPQNPLPYTFLLLRSFIHLNPPVTTPEAGHHLLHVPHDPFPLARGRVLTLLLEGG